MLKKLIVGVSVVISSLLGIFLVAGRGTHEIRSLARATADVTADGVVESISEAVHDRKIDQEMKQVRMDLVDRQVQMNLSARKIEELSGEVTKLERSTDRRKRLLSEAYPILKEAIDGKQEKLTWANQEFTLVAFQKEIDDLLAMQDRETHQLTIKRDGLARLTKSVE
ncbi:MAG: hypothetical protein FJ267_07960, partial [Planctomycetes bacterium]|nr:hypothetical protein [Planctomycetota bacterium]